MNVMNEEAFGFLFSNEVRDYSTKAADGIYLAISDMKCDCCDEKISTHKPLVVKKGRVNRKSLEAAAKHLVSLHPTHYAVEAVEWNGDGSFTLSFGS